MMIGSERIFITGLSMLSACGNTAEATWEAVLAGQGGIADIQQWDVSSWSHRLGGELKNFQPEKMLPDRKLIKVISRQDAMGIHAAVQAVQHSQIPAYCDTLNTVARGSFNEGTGIYVGSPGNKYLQQYDFLPLLAKTGDDMQQFAHHLFDEVHPMWLLRILPNNVLAYTGITYGFKGPNHNITNHAVSGSQAILEAYYAIKTGQAERAVVVAYDVGIEPQALFYYANLGLISPRHLKPFDKDHDGTILAEGAAALVLESASSVKARSASCYGEIVGGISASEGTGLFSTQTEGGHLAQLLGRTLKTYQISSADIAMLVAHGNGNPQSDNSEALAIQAVFRETRIPITAFKWAMGHTLCASGILDTVLASYALHHRCIPGVASFSEVAPFCGELSISACHRDIRQGNCVILINRGFASMNACLVIKACD